MELLILHGTFKAFFHQYLGIGASTGYKKVNVNKFALN